MTNVINSPDQLITQPSKHTGLTAKQLMLAVAAGRLPEPIRLGVRLRAWKRSDLDRLVTGQTAPTTTPAAQTV